MAVALRAANDNANVSAITYGPVVLAGNYGNSSLKGLPTLQPSSITRTSAGALAFTATANSATVNLAPFYDAQGFNYTVYWNANGQGGATCRLVNAGSGLLLGIQDMPTADSGRALQWSDNGNSDHNWEMITDGDAVRFRNVNSGKLLAIQNNSTGVGAFAVQGPDNGAATNRWRVVRNG
jgi:hypothetical protein